MCFLEDTEKSLVSRAGRERIISNWINDNLAELQRYKYIIFDHNSAGKSIINQNVYYAADSILLITDVSPESIRGVENFYAQWEDTRKQLGKDNNIKALIINNFDVRLGLAPQLVDFCSKHEEFRELLIDTIIPYNARIKESGVVPTPPINLMPNGRKMDEIFRNAINELKEKGVL